VIFFGPRALLGASPFKAVIMSSFFTFIFIVCGSRYIKPGISLRSASIGSGKKCFVRIVAFFLLLWYRVSSFGLLIGGNYSRAFGFLSTVHAYFAILYTPLELFISFSIVCLYSLLVPYRIALFFLLYTTL